MKVKYKDGSLLGVTDFSFREDDYVTIVVRYWVKKDDEDDIYYHGFITELNEEREGFWVRLDDAPDKEEFFTFTEIETVLPGDRIPFLEGTTTRI
ncbi:MAG: hypothetical protein R3267_02685 [Paenisporosarcina sp.]|nr:hypothetical protein [Paenisporosarcina sp.]